MTAIAAASSGRIYRQAADFLSTLDDDWARHIAATGPCGHQPKPAREPYEALVRAIAYQQLHAKAGDAILGRLLALCPGPGFPTPEQLLTADEAALRGCGFSARKLAAIRGIAQATLDGIVPNRDDALSMPDEALIDRLVSLRGVGRWTVEMLLIYSLARTDVLPGDDFGVRDGYRRLKRLAAAPPRKQILEISQAWRPYRTIATWYLWRVPAAQAASQIP